MSEAPLHLPVVAGADVPEAVRVAADLSRYVEPVAADTPVQEVSERAFDEAFVVIDGERVVGLVTRRLLSEKLFSRFGHALYGHRPIASLALVDALRVPTTTTLDLALVGALARPMQHAYDDVVVVDDANRYVGLLEVKRLVQHQMHALVAARRSRRSAEDRAAKLAEHAELTSRFLATVTHELRAPVNTMVGLAELVGAQLERGRHDRAGAHVSTMRKTAAHLRGLVDDVLDQAKLDARMVEVDVDDFDLHSLVEDVAEATRPLVLGKRVEVRVDGANRPCPVRSDRLKVRQIVTNFASNAAKHTDVGSVVIGVVRRGDTASVSVEDTGPGIPSEALQLLFQPFVQVGDPATRRHGGTGLGLANARRFAELIGARIEVSSVVGRGSRFTVHVPSVPRREDE